MSPSSRREVLGRDPVVLSQAVRWTNRRRTRAAAVLALLGGPAIVTGVVLAAMRPGVPTRVETTTAGAWAATGALSDGLRELEPGDPLTPLRDEARAARAAVQEAGKAVKALELDGAEASAQRLAVRALRADDAWIDAVGSTLANPRSDRRRDLSRLAKNAAVATALIADDVEGSEDSVGGTGRLLSATSRRGGGRAASPE
ncbi:MAG: hypothetical protein H0V81_04980 [Solirubrobacterales bacterium]|nr:hypothetical protein [Solirubrobacterales bacterium]